MASERVVYKIDGANFETYKAYVMQSHGLIDRPAKKPVLSYEWPDEVGTEYDTAAALKYKERKISLEMIFLGDDWADINTNFNSLMDKFDGAGTKELKVKPFDFTEMTFNVLLLDEVILQKRFWNGAMHGLAVLNLTEPEPTI